MSEIKEYEEGIVLGLHQVECPIDKIAELILEEYPNFYRHTKDEKYKMIAVFVKPIHHDCVYEYMEKPKE